jgi:hypothetical protein
MMWAPARCTCHGWPRAIEADPSSLAQAERTAVPRRLRVERGARGELSLLARTRCCKVLGEMRYKVR